MSLKKRGMGPREREERRDRDCAGEAVSGEGEAMTKVRTMQVAGEDWASANDIRDALNDDDMILRAAAMLKVAKVEHHNDAIDMLRKAIAYFFTEATGALAHHEN